MRDYGAEVFDTDNDMHILLHMKIFEILSMDSDGGLQRLLENF